MRKLKRIAENVHMIQGQRLNDRKLSSQVQSYLPLLTYEFKLSHITYGFGLYICDALELI